VLARVVDGLGSLFLCVGFALCLVFITEIGTLSIEGMDVQLSVFIPIDSLCFCLDSSIFFPYRYVYFCLSPLILVTLVNIYDLVVSYVPVLFG
jgi:hypothetical protein